MNTTLSLDQVTKIFSLSGKNLLVLKNISVEFQQNTSYALTGHSGSGKSTLLHILSGIDNPTTGRVLYNNQERSNWNICKQKKFLQNDIGLVFQNPYLIPELTVLENIIIKGLITGDSEILAKKKGFELLEQIGLQSKASDLPMFLSGGEAQRIGLLRALFNRPKFIIADEPLAHLDINNQQNILNMLKDGQQNWGLGIIISWHNLELAKKTVDLIYNLDQAELKLCAK